MARNSNNDTKPPSEASYARRNVAAPNCVTVFGGGVTGLTVAHELVERGFTVQVWEPTPSERNPYGGCDVGGMARTQWSRVPWPEQLALGDSPVAPVKEKKHPDDDPIHWANRRTDKIIPLPWVFYIGPRGKPLSKRHIQRAISEYEDVDKQADIARVVNEMADRLGDCLTADDVIYCEIETWAPPKPGETGEKRATPIVEWLKKKLKNWELSDPSTGDYALKDRPEGDYTEHLRAALVRKKGAGKTDRIELRIVFLDTFPDGIEAKVHARMSFRIRERWLPGEHGLHFFPAFYHHLLDTMKRTPILEPDVKADAAASQERSVTVNANPERYVATGRTVFDNLRPTTKQSLSFHDGRRPSVMSRSGPQSLEEIRDWLRTVLKSSEGRRYQRSDEPFGSGERYAKELTGGLGLTARDIARFHLKTLQYMTSCDARRREYEQVSWFDFLGGPTKFSDNFKNVVNDWPEALVAMDANSSDARTQGSAFAQLLLDNVRREGYRDGTLNGPVSVAWFTPWRRYLEAQGVEFIHGEIAGFERTNSPGGVRVWPTVKCYEPRYPGAMARKPELMPGYFVLALPAQKAQVMAQSLLEQLDENATGEEAARDALRLTEWDLTDPDDPKDLQRASPTGALRHMVGIQFYFDEDVYWVDGHFYFPLSDWGLSAISQARFWGDKQDWEHGYRGILSVVFTLMDNPATYGPVAGKTVWDCSEEDIAKGVWAQVKASFADQHLPEPRYWHLDFDFTRAKDEDKWFYVNKSPLVINIPGEYQDRPGDLIEIKRGQLKLDGELSKYAVLDGVVFAGTHMKTFTRLTCMEAANESGRHAVNAILQHAREHRAPGKPVMRATPCDIWPMELREVDDFQFLKDLDAELYERKLSHFVEILELDELVTNGHRGSRRNIDDPFDPFYVMTEIDRFAKRVGAGFIDALKRTPGER